LEPRAGRQVLLGVRPEDVRLANGSSGQARARVDAVEPMGNETLVHGAAGEGERLTARLGPRELPEIGAERWFEVDEMRLHFFEPDSGERLGAASG
jgi:ABC-type sugar transport system ATPase subunit